MNAIQDADSLCEEFESLADGEYPHFEEADYIPVEVFKKKFKKDIYEVIKEINYEEITLSEINFEWSEDNEDSIRKICPKTFDKWWGNNKFF